jgi:type IX secretion system PorP/SprF family membrane protein
MNRYWFIFLYCGFLAVNNVFSQNVSYGPGFQTILQDNPAFAGSEGDGTLRLSYLNFYPGNNFNLNSVYISYDSFFEGLHGGAGFYLADDYLGGIINDVRGGLAYSYHLQAGRNLFINAGLTASCYYRGYNTGRMILPDQIDPLNGAVIQSVEALGNRNRAVFDIGTGLMIMTGRYFAALSVMHLTNPDLSGTGLESEKTGRKVFLNVSGKFALNESANILVRPLLLAEIQNRNFSFGAGSTIENEMLSLSAVLMANSSESIDMQAGCSFKKGRVAIFYNYKFNIHSGASMLPVSLLHQAGLAFSLNYVDKRKLINAINFPKL